MEDKMTDKSGDRKMKGGMMMKDKEMKKKMAPVAKKASKVVPFKYGYKPKK